MYVCIYIRIYIYIYIYYHIRPRKSPQWCQYYHWSSPVTHTKGHIIEQNHIYILSAYTRIMSYGYVYCTGLIVDYNQMLGYLSRQLGSFLKHFEMV